MPAPSAFALPPRPPVFTATTTTPDSLPPLPQMMRSDTQQSLDVMIPKAKGIGSTASAASSIWGTVKRTMGATRGFRDDETKSLASFSRQGSIGSFDGLPTILSTWTPQPMATLHLPPSLTGEQPIDAKLYNFCTGTGRYPPDLVPSEVPANASGHLIFYDGRTLPIDQAEVQGVVRTRPQTFKSRERAEEKALDTAAKMESSLTLQGSSASIPGIPLASDLIPRAFFKLGEIEVRGPVKWSSVYAKISVKVNGLEEQCWTTPARVLKESGKASVAGFGLGYLLDVPLGTASLTLSILATRTPTKSKLGSLFGKPTPSASPSTESVTLARFSMSLNQKMQILSPTSAILDPLDPKICKGVRIGFAASGYMDERWDDEEEESSETGSVVGAMDGMKVVEKREVREVEEFEGGLSVMGVQANGKTFWKRIHATLTNHGLSIYPHHASADPLAILPLSQLLCISSPDPEFSLPSANGMCLTFSTGSDEAWRETYVKDGQMVAFADTREGTGRWVVSLAGAGARVEGFNLVEEGRRAGLGMIGEEDEE